MKELLYTVLELERWNISSTCDFCSKFENSENKAVCQIRTRNKLTEKLVANDCACENCKEKFENDELPKCGDCGRLQNKSRIFNGKFVCRCVEYKENTKEKELPVLPHERRQATFYERQINSLQEKLNEAEWTIHEEREVHEDFMEKSEEWGKKQKQELLDRIKELEAENKRLREQNKIEAYEKEIAELRNQLTSQQQTAQIEVKEPKKWPWKIRK